MTRTTVAAVPNQPKTPQRTVRIPDETWAALKSLAEDEGTNASEIVRELIEDRLREAGR